MKKVCCVRLIPSCSAEFYGRTEREVIERYAAHVRAEHGRPCERLTLLHALVDA
jgi:predicted small metal-binding protein